MNNPLKYVPQHYSELGKKSVFKVVIFLVCLCHASYPVWGKKNTETSPKEERMKITVYRNDIPDGFSLPGDLALDTETMGLQVHRDRLCVLQMSNGDGNCYLVHFDGSDYSAPNLKNLLEDESTCKIFHYARFDLAVIKKYLGVDIKHVFCTKVASKLVRTYTDQHSLKDLCLELLGVSVSKQQQSSYWGVSELSEEQKEYAARDVMNLHRLRAILSERLVESGRKELAERVFRFLPTRVELDIAGWNDVDIFAYK